MFECAYCKLTPAGRATLARSDADANSPMLLRAYVAEDNKCFTSTAGVFACTNGRCSPDMHGFVRVRALHTCEVAVGAVCPPHCSHRVVLFFLRVLGEAAELYGVLRRVEAAFEDQLCLVFAKTLVASKGGVLRYLVSPSTWDSDPRVLGVVGIEKVICAL